MDRHVTFEARGETYGLRFTFTAIRACQRELGLSIDQFIETLDDRSPEGVEKAAAIFRHALEGWRLHERKREEPFTVEDVDAILDDLGYHQRWTTLAAEAVALGAVEDPKARPAAAPPATPTGGGSPA